MRTFNTLLPTALLGALLATTAAWASHPTPSQMERVQILAHELEDAARHVHRDAERSAHHYTRAENHALRKLHKLEARARHFHREVERYYQDPYHTERDFERLLDAFHEARYAMHHLHAFRHTRRDFHRVERLMHRLTDYYGGYDSGHRYDRHRYDGHRYDRHRYDRRDTYPGAHGRHDYDRGVRWITKPDHRRSDRYENRYDRRRDSDEDSDSDSDSHRH